MRLSPYQAWRLRGIERTLSQSEPHMAAMLAIFTRLSTGEALGSCEQARSARQWAQLAAAALWGTLAAVFRESARAGGAAWRGLGRIARHPLSVLSVSAGWLDPGRSVGL